MTCFEAGDSRYGVMKWSVYVLLIPETFDSLFHGVSTILKGSQREVDSDTNLDYLYTAILRVKGALKRGGFLGDTLIPGLDTCYKQEIPHYFSE